MFISGSGMLYPVLVSAKARKKVKPVRVKMKKPRLIAKSHREAGSVKKYLHEFSPMLLTLLHVFQHFPVGWAQAHAQAFFGEGQEPVVFIFKTHEEIIGRR